MKKIDLHQDIVLSFEQNKEGFIDSTKVVDLHGSYAGNLHDYHNSDTVLVWSANWPYHLIWDLSDVKGRKITYDQSQIVKRCALVDELAQIHHIRMIKYKNDLTDLAKLNFLHHVEWVDHVQSVADIQALYDIGVRSVGFVWNFDNFLSNNNTSSDCSWLTDLGKDVVVAMNELWMIVDTAHMNHQSMMDVVKLSTKPILNSHSNIKTLHHHTRNIEDEFIDAIAINGGVIGLSVFNAFISAEPSVTIEQYWDQIRYIKDRIGEDYVALWTDFHGLVTSQCVEWLQHISQLHNLEEYIVKHFWSSFAQKFFYDNSMRVLQSNLQ